MRVNSICVYCASSETIDDCYHQAAERLGTLMGEQGITLINGAGNTGLMRACTDACLGAGGQAIGIIPTFMIENGWCHTGMTTIIATPDMHSRQEKMASQSDGAIVLPGGCGTFAELLELITWRQLGLYRKPLVILNTNGYYDSLLRMLEEAKTKHFMRPQKAPLWEVAVTPEEALELIHNS